jgi:imidazolonepropionase
MNTAEIWCAITLNAAHAVNLLNQGVIRKGFAPRFSIFNTNNINEILYNWGNNLFFECKRR